MAIIHRRSYGRQFRAGASASIGLVSTSTWLLGGLCISAATGFSDQVAHLIGAGRYPYARNVLRQALLGGVLLSPGVVPSALYLPVWLGGGGAIRADAFHN